MPERDYHIYRVAHEETIVLADLATRFSLSKELDLSSGALTVNASGNIQVVRMTESGAAKIRADRDYLVEGPLETR